MNYLEIKPEVKEALEQGKAVVALESTIIAHGMPYPKNVETALAVEDVIRKNGAVPATIAIIDGVIKVGLTPEEIEYLGTAKGVMKVSRRDFPVVMAKKMDGATTVAGTMMAAAMAGVCAASVYGGMTYYYSGRFFEGTTINGIDCSGLTAYEAEEAIAKVCRQPRFSVAEEFILAQPTLQGGVQRTVGPSRESIEVHIRRGQQF